MNKDFEIIIEDYMDSVKRGAFNISDMPWFIGRRLLDTVPKYLYSDVIGKPREQYVNPAFNVLHEAICIEAKKALEADPDMDKYVARDKVHEDRYNMLVKEFTEAGYSLDAIASIAGHTAYRDRAVNLSYDKAHWGDK